MPISMMFVKCNQFYTPGLQINAQTQLVGSEDLALTEGEGHLYLDPTDEIINFGDSYFNIYKVDYDHKCVTKGFVFEKEFSYYFKNYKFKVYHEPDKQILLLSVKKDISNALIKELSKEKHSNKKLYSFQQLNIDFDKIIKKAENLSGLWAQIDRANVHSQAYFGDNINMDAEVKMVLKERKTSYVIFETSIGEIDHKIGITKNGNIVLYNNFESEHEQIKIAYLVYEMFLKD